jgi:hypothetical protein
MTKLISEQDKLRHFLRTAQAILGLVLLALKILVLLVELYK